MLNMRTFDAQQALGFLVSQTAYIEPIVYRIKYPAIRYPGLIPIDTSANMWTPSVMYYTLDEAGQAEWFSSQADDMAHADVIRSQAQTGIKMAGLGYAYDLQELGIAQLLGQNLTTDKAEAARRGGERKIDSVVFFGDAAVGWEGLANSSVVTAGNAGNGVGGSPLWLNKTPAENLYDVNNTLTGIYTGSNEVEMADTVLIPPSHAVSIGTRQLSDLSGMTILEWLKKNNTYTLETGNELVIRGIRGLETAGVGGTARMVAYRRDPSVVKLHMPMPFRFFPVYQAGPMKFEVPGAFRIGPVDIKRPGSFRYLDGI